MLACDVHIPSLLHRGSDTARFLCRCGSSPGFPVVVGVVLNEVVAEEVVKLLETEVEAERL